MALKTLFQTQFQAFAILWGGIRSAGCWLSRAVGSQNAVVLMLRKLLLLNVGGRGESVDSLALTHLVQRLVSLPPEKVTKICSLGCTLASELVTLLVTRLS